MSSLHDDFKDIIINNWEFIESFWQEVVDKTAFSLRRNQDELLKLARKYNRQHIIDFIVRNTS